MTERANRNLENAEHRHSQYNPSQGAHDELFHPSNRADWSAAVHHREAVINNESHQMLSGFHLDGADGKPMVRGSLLQQHSGAVERPAYHQFTEEQARNPLWGAGEALRLGSQIIADPREHRFHSHISGNNNFTGHSRQESEKHGTLPPARFGRW